MSVTTPAVPTAAALASSGLSDSTMLQLYDAVESVASDSSQRWSSIAKQDLLADLETACGLRGIAIGSGTKVQTETLNLLR